MKRLAFTFGLFVLVWYSVVAELGLHPDTETLRIIGSDLFKKQLIAAAKGRNSNTDWILAPLGRLPAENIHSALKGDTISIPSNRSFCYRTP